MPSTDRIVWKVLLLNVSNRCTNPYGIYQSYLLRLIHLIGEMKHGILKVLVFLRTRSNTVFDAEIATLGTRYLGGA